MLDEPRLLCNYEAATLTLTLTLTQNRTEQTESKQSLLQIIPTHFDFILIFI